MQSTYMGILFVAHIINMYIFKSCSGGLLFCRFSSNPDQTQLPFHFLVILNALINWFRCMIRVGAKLYRTVVLKVLIGITLIHPDVPWSCLLLLKVEDSFPDFTESEVKQSGSIQNASVPTATRSIWRTATPSLLHQEIYLNENYGRTNPIENPGSPTKHSLENCTTTPTVKI